jgi:hypothetical protein
VASARVALLLSLALVGAAAGAEPDVPSWQVGDRIAPFELPDQHGQPGRVDESVRILLFSADMDAAEHVEQALERPRAAGPAARGAVFVSDIACRG